jgi:hypothetical protein
MKKTGFLWLLLVGIQLVFSADPSEEGVKTSPVTIYSGGIAGGAFFALSDELSEESEQYLKLAFINNIYVIEPVNLFVDVNWFAPGNNFGADLGFDLVFSRSDFQGFLGAGVGAHVFNKTGNEFGDDFGPSATAHVGFALGLGERVQVQARIPFHIALNAATDMCIGLDIGFLFSDKFKKVKKLNY